MNTENTDNFRPISVLPAVSKLLERAVRDQLYLYLTRYHLLNLYCVFRRSHFTETTAIAPTDTI